MFHLRDNLYFGRLADGSVRILKFKTPPMAVPQAHQIFAREDVLLDMGVPWESWVSMVVQIDLAKSETICVQGDGKGGMDQVIDNGDGSVSRRKVL